MFEKGDIENLKAEDLKNFIRKRINEKIVELGYADMGNYVDYDKESASKLDWFYHLTGGVTHTDFFAIRPTDYSKANENEDWDELW
jgi:ribonucleoside-diphosphate reductase beta chain